MPRALIHRRSRAFGPAVFRQSTRDKGSEAVTLEEIKHWERLCGSDGAGVTEITQASDRS